MAVKEMKKGNKPKSRTVKDCALFYSVYKLRKNIGIHNRLYPNKYISIGDVLEEYERQNQNRE